MSPRNLPRTTAMLETLGISPLVRSLLSGPLPDTVEYNFSTIQMAKRVQALLYNWMFFYPEIKARTTLRLMEETATLYIIPRATTERRGRGKLP